MQAFENSASPAAQAPSRAASRRKIRRSRRLRRSTQSPTAAAAGSIDPTLARTQSLDPLRHLSRYLRGNGDSQRLGRPPIDDQVEDRWLLRRQVGGLGPAQDPIDIKGGVAAERRSV